VIAGEIWINNILVPCRWDRLLVQSFLSYGFPSNSTNAFAAQDQGCFESLRLVDNGGSDVKAQIYERFSVDEIQQNVNRSTALTVFLKWYGFLRLEDLRPTQNLRYVENLADLLGSILEAHLLSTIHQKCKLKQFTARL